MGLSPELRGMLSSAKNKYKNNNSKTIKPKEGRNTYRFLAPLPGEKPWIPVNGQFWVDLGVHWIKADESGKPIAVIGDCETVYQRPSVINTAIHMAIESAMDEDSKKLFESWRPRRSVLVNVIDRSDDSVAVLELTTTTFSKYLDLMMMYDDAGQNINDPVNGVDIVIRREGKGLQTEYDVAVAPGVSKPVTKEHMERIADLNEFVAANYFRGEEQKALNAIQQIAGIAVPALTSSASTPTAALTSAAASVADSGPAVDPEAEARKQAALTAQQAAAAHEQERAAPAPTPEPASAPTLDKSEEDALLAELDGLENL